MKEQSKALKDQEEVLVVSTEILYPDGTHQGLKQDNLEETMETIIQNSQFLPRFMVEENSAFKQIIPYIVFSYQKKLFLTQRKSNHTDKRLADLFSLGIGGHIRKDETVGKDAFRWAQREFQEEVDYRGDFKIRPLGLLNDDSAPVHAVHAGLVLLLEGDSPEIRIKDEHKSGELRNLKECVKVYGQMEKWSQIVFDFLKNNG